MKRRHFIKTTGLAIGASLLYQPTFAEADAQQTALIHLPDQVTALINNQVVTLTRSGNNFVFRDVIVSFETGRSAQTVFIQALVPVQEITLLWKISAKRTTVLNDHWERTYGDAAWHPPVADERFPWYFMETGEAGTSGMGVKTNAAAFCAWAFDAGNLTLTLDTRSGGNGVALNNRKLKAVELVAITRKGNETPFETAKRFMKLMCDKPRMPKQPVYGINDWYFSYGNNSSKLILEHTKLIAPAADGLKNRPFSIIDDGW
ncbi:MAG TPA: hypothetical protein VFM90_06945, partial [Cyclobacteriaceae bacterium]|nr:hypothetical protein [Cyclobacteriaceae bacterium]